MKKKVYVAGPFGAGDQLANIHNAIAAGEQLAQLGYAPFIPHMNALWHLQYPHERDFWLDQDNQWLPACDALLRLPGESPGSDAEVALAESLGIPVYYCIGHLDWELNG